jgi:hypothetical protein
MLGYCVVRPVPLDPLEQSMDHQTRTFLDLTGTTDLVELVADRRAAWLWSSDGGRVLWANAAGAAFFSSDSVSALANLNSLERSPARPHIARIAASGFEDRFSIDRLRFYRGLRVMLLTCQCKKVVLEDGSAAALIICADKGFSTTKDPVVTFAQLVSNSDVTVFVTDRGLVSANYGSLTGTPEDIAPLDGHNAVFGPIELDGALHDGALFQLSEDQKLIALNNERIETPEVEGPEVDAAPLDISSDEVDVTTDPAGSVWARADVLEEAAEALPSMAAADPEDKTAEIQDNLEIATDAAAEGPDSEAEVVQPPADGDDQAQEPADTADEAALIDSPPALGAPEDLDASSNAPENDSAADEGEPEFVFQPGRRPVRFAWKMDISQRFTFLSDEFANVVGPASADIVGLTWAEVANRFDLDPRGSIARALDRRDTWSGKTVDWPVTDAALRVPVDMAALPAFDRNRTFEGYRGFGVCRAADAKPGARIAALSPPWLRLTSIWAMGNLKLTKKTLTHQMKPNRLMIIVRLLTSIRLRNPRCPKAKPHQSPQRKTSSPSNRTLWLERWQLVRAQQRWLAPCHASRMALRKRPPNHTHRL